MESPLRKAQRRNDYNRHKVLRQIKRRNKAKREQEQQAAEKELRKKLRMPKYGDGKLYGVNGNQPIKFDEEGNLVNQVTGDTGTMVLPEVAVRPSAPITNNSNEYFNWLMRESSRGGRNFSLQDINSYGRAMQRIANRNEIHNVIGYDGTVYLHGGGGLNIVSPEFDLLALGGPRMLSEGAGNVISNISRIANNVKNRNLFTYKYLAPAGYRDPFSKGFNLVKKILTEPEMKDIPNPNWVDEDLGLGNYLLAERYYDNVSPSILESASKLGNRFRDSAYRKYLGIPQKEPIYLENKDGSFSYNMPYINQLYEQYGLHFKPVIQKGKNARDYVTGNGGGLTGNDVVDFGYGIGRDAKKQFGINKIEDIWDLHPFSRKADRLDSKYTDYVSKKANSIYNSLYPYIYSNNKFGKFGYKYLGGSKLNQIRYDESKIPLKHVVKNIADKMSKFEVGPILGGKPFTMKTDVPFTRQIVADGKNGYLIKDVEYGLNADDLLPQQYFNYKRYGTTDPFRFNADAEFNSNVKFQDAKTK